MFCHLCFCPPVCGVRESVITILSFGFKYGIPMGTWEEVEAACWEEHPVKWGKPECSLYDFEIFVNARW